MNSARLHLLSFDLEEWFYIYSGKQGFDPSAYWESAEGRAEAIIERLLSLLNRHKATATFFCMGEFARRYPVLIQKIVAAGHEIGAHSDRHLYAKHQTLAEFESDLIANLQTLKQISGQKIVSYRTPAYSIDTLQPAYLVILTRLGILYNSSMKAGSTSVYGKLPNQPIQISTTPLHWALPVSTSRLCSTWAYGSGFFRLTPQQWIMSLLHKPGYHLLYFHPRDFDPAMRRLPATWFDRLKYGIRTHAMFDRLEALLGTFPMYSIEKGVQTSAFKQML